MKTLAVQLQPALAPGLDEQATIATLRSLAGPTDRVTIARGDENNPYTNVTFETDDVIALWKLVREQLIGTAASARSPFARSAIVACAGEPGWDDYVLLHHFDPAQPREELT